ncbi:MAG TPA: hypothetical protein PK863_02015 [Candidatus Dojkabacteria bacterium]|nr:hypothetical protein [Candidatus Dojkabacteria bacterium]HRP50764.1 hypothetical protein [Candidatus Dojkabacteria bacterium]
MAVVITQTANPAGVNTSSNVATYSSVAIGAAAANRIVVVLVGSELASASINSVTLGGNAMSAGTQGNFGAVYARAFYLAYPTGTTADIVVTYGAGATSTQNHIAVYSVTGGVYSATGADQSSDMDTTDRLTTGAITIASGGGFIAIAAGATDTAAKTWANATEDLDVDAGGFRFTTATRTTALTATAVTCTGGTNGEDGALSYLLFTANVSPTVALNSPADTATITDTTPELIFTGTDTESNDIRYNVQVDTVNTFDSLGGAEDALYLNDNGNLNASPLSTYTNGMSFFCWVQLETLSRYHLIWSNGRGGDYGEGYEFYITSGDNSLIIGLSYIGGHSSSLSITDTDWHFVGFTRNSGTWTLYLDGSSEVVGTGNPYSINGANSKSMIGGYNDAGTPVSEFKGSIARVGYWERVLSGGEIAGLYAGALVSTLSSNLVIDCQLDDSANFGVNDGSAGDFTESGTLTEDTLGFDAVGGGPLIDAVSGTDAGFLDSPDESDTDPFTSGTAVAYTVQSALDPDTYYWRVRGLDPSGSNSYGAWSSIRSFTITSGETEVSITKTLAYKVQPSVSITKTIAYRIKTDTAITKNLAYSIVDEISITKGLTYEVIVTTTETIQKDVDYTIITDSSIQKGLEYQVVTNAQIQKDLDYFIKLETSIQKDLDYTILTSDSVVKDLEYIIIITDSINKDLDYTVLTEGLIQKSMLYEVVVTGIEKVQATLDYTVITSTTIQKDLEYFITTEGLIQKDLSYKVQPSTTITKDLTYTVESQQDVTKDLDYHIVIPKLIQKDVTYFIKGSTGIQKDADYSVITTIDQDKALDYRVITEGDIQKDVDYYISITTNVEKDINYNLQVSTTIQKGVTYSIDVPSIIVQKELDYAIVTTTSTTTDLDYNILLESTIQKDTDYSVMGSTAITKGIEYTVIAPQSIEQALQYTIAITPSALEKALEYIIVQRTTKQYELRYRVDAPHSISKDLMYTIGEKIGIWIKHPGESSDSFTKDEGVSSTYTKTESVTASSYTKEESVTPSIYTKTEKESSLWTKI